MLPTEWINRQKSIAIEMHLAVMVLTPSRHFVVVAAIFGMKISRRNELYFNSKKVVLMTIIHQKLLSRRHFCLCCVAGATFAATGGWLTPREAFAEARGLVSLIKDSAATSPIVTHKLRNNISVFEGSGEGPHRCGHRGITSPTHNSSCRSWE